MKTIVLRSWEEDEAEDAIVGYVRNNRSAYVSDIAESLRRDFHLAFRIVARLLNGRVLHTAGKSAKNLLPAARSAKP